MNYNHYYYNENGVYATATEKRNLGTEISKEKYDELKAILAQGAPQDGKKYQLTIDGDWLELPE